MRFGPTAAALAADEITLADSMRRAQAGDREAYARVLAHCRDTFERLARERFSTGDTDDVVGRCLITLHRRRHTFGAGRSFAVWVEAIARHDGIGPDRPRHAWHARIVGLLRALQGTGAGLEIRAE